MTNLVTYKMDITVLCSVTYCHLLELHVQSLYCQRHFMFCCFIGIIDNIIRWQVNVNNQSLETRT